MSLEHDPLFAPDGYASGLAFDHVKRLPLERPLQVILTEIFNSGGVVSPVPDFVLGDETMYTDPVLNAVLDTREEVTRVMSITVTQPGDFSRIIPSDVATYEMARDEGVPYVAIQVHTGGKHETDMLDILQAEAPAGVRKMAVVYPRISNGTGGINEFAYLRDSEMPNDWRRYTAMVADGVRKVAPHAHVIKAPYCYEFERVIEAAGSVPVFIAGGENRGIRMNAPRIGWAIRQGARGAVIGRGILLDGNPVNAAIAFNSQIHSPDNPNINRPQNLR